eukprot:EC715347.1.p1 GENE.EC715347.1~~EC715347.1.p1  ORF type:complete len:77 (+),score=7.03 EC715347.1:67-297(+)
MGKVVGIVLGCVLIALAGGMSYLSYDIASVGWNGTDILALVRAIGQSNQYLCVIFLLVGSALCFSMAATAQEVETY